MRLTEKDFKMNINQTSDVDGQFPRLDFRFDAKTDSWSVISAPRLTAGAFVIGRVTWNRSGSDPNPIFSFVQPITVVSRGARALPEDSFAEPSGSLDIKTTDELLAFMRLLRIGNPAMDKFLKEE